MAYLGPDTPMETLADAARRMGADWVVVSEDLRPSVSKAMRRFAKVRICGVARLI